LASLSEAPVARDQMSVRRRVTVAASAAASAAIHGGRGEKTRDRERGRRTTGAENDRRTGGGGKKLNVHLALDAVTTMRAIRVKQLQIDGRQPSAPLLISSFKEGHAQKLARTQRAEWRRHNASCISRVYPAATRQDSSNIPAQVAVTMWDAGVQMVAFNFQTPSRAMLVNQALFSLNGGCGYVLRPEFRDGLEAAVSDEQLSCSETSAVGSPRTGSVKSTVASPRTASVKFASAPPPSPSTGSSKFAGSAKFSSSLASHSEDSSSVAADLETRGVHLRLRVMFATHLPKNRDAPVVPMPWDVYHPTATVFAGSSALGMNPTEVVSPACSVELIGGRTGRLEEGLEAATSEFIVGTTATAIEDGLAPSWDHEFTAAIWEPESSLLLLTITNQPRVKLLSKKGDVLARACVPVSALRPGYRSMQLQSPNGSTLEESLVFVHVIFEPLGALSVPKKLRATLVGRRDPSVARPAERV
jgi:hypothetical protein